MQKNTTIGIIGGGPAGYVSALHAAKKGFNIILFESEKLGGTCLHCGCIPTKQLLHLTGYLHQLSLTKRDGLNVKEVSIDFQKLLASKKRLLTRLESGIHHLIDQAKITYVKATAVIADEHHISANNELYAVDYIIIATGSHDTVPVAFKDKTITSRDLLSIDRIPTDLVIIGGGVIGIETAEWLSALGTKVTIIEQESRLLPSVDIEAATIIMDHFRHRKIDCFTHHSVKTLIRQESGSIIITLDDNTTITASHVLIAMGRSATIPATSLDLKTTQRGYLSINQYYQTHYPYIYAIGDVNGVNMLAHAASYQGKCAIEHILSIQQGQSLVADSRPALIPSVIYSQPMIASIGLQEQHLQKNHSYRIVSIPFQLMGRAQITRELTGFCKLLYDSKNDHLVGALVTGIEAETFLPLLTLAIQEKISLGALCNIVFAHPTLQEILEKAFITLSETIPPSSQ